MVYSLDYVYVAVFFKVPATTESYPYRHTLSLHVALPILGGSSTSRLIMDLRETKGWAYYAGSALPGVKETIPLLVYAPVQTDKTGEPIVAARKDIGDFLTEIGRASCRERVC